MPVKSTTASCEVDQSILYAGTINFPNPPKATMLYFNSYEIIVTGGNAAKGEGLLFFPYLMKRIPVEWENITIRKGEDPEDPFMSDFGCIVGKGDKIQVQGSDASVLSEDLDKQFTALAAWLNDPGSFTGTFGEAIKLMKKLAEKLSTGQTIDPADLKEFKSACKAVNKGTDQWISQIKSIVGTHPSKETTELLASIASAKLQVLEMLDCGNANATPPAPKKGPSWDDNFLLAECDYEKAKESAGELTKQSDNSKGIFTPPPTDKLTCLVKLSDLKKQLNVTISTFLCPDGGLINLDDADEIKFYTYDKSLYPNGSILGVKKGTKNYIARIITYTSAFTGFVDWDIWKSQGHPPDPTFHSTAPELNKNLSVWAIELNQSQEVRSIGKADYSAEYYKQGEVSILGRNRLNYGMDQAASSCNFKSNSTDAPAMEGYSSQSGLDDLTKKLKKYGGLGDVIFKITDKDGKVSYVTKDKQYKPNEGTPTGTNGSDKTTFEITEDANGKVDVKGKFKADPGCPKCAGEAEKALNAAIAEMATKHGGKIDPKKNVIEPSDFNINAGLAYNSMSLAEVLSAMAKGYNDLVSKAKVPEAVWVPDTELKGEDKDFPVRDNWGLIAGGIDGAVNEFSDKAQLVGMILTVVSNPKETAKNVAKFAKNTFTDWDKSKALAGTMVEGMVGINKSDFEEGKKPVYKGHGTGFIAGTLSAQAAMGGIALLAILQNAPDQLDNLAARIAKLLGKLKEKLQKINWSDVDIDKLISKFDNWSEIDIQRFLDDFDTVSEDIFKGFRDGKFDLEASKALVLGKDGVTGKILRRISSNLKTLTEIKKILPSDITMDDIRNAIINSTSKQDFLDELSRFDANNLDELRDFLKKKGLRTTAVSKGDLPFNGLPDANVTTIVSNRQAARNASQNLDVNSPTYDADYKANMKNIMTGSEQAAEAMADLHFGKTNSIDLSLPSTAKQGQFDKVYKNADGSFSVVECKGGASELGSRAGHQQCTKPYIESIIENLNANIAKLTDAQKLSLSELEGAVKAGKIKSYRLKQKFKDDGSLGDTILTEYNF